MALMRLSLVFVLIVAVTMPVQATDFAREIRNRGVVMWEDTSWGKSYAQLPLAELIARVRSVSDTPSDVYFGRNVLRNPAGGLFGIITGVLGVRVAFDQGVTPQPGGLDRAMFIRPAEQSRYATWMRYFTGEAGTPGSLDSRTSLLLRRRARVLKLHLFLEEQTGMQLEELTDADVAHLRDDPEFVWIVNEVFEPVTVIFEPEFLRALGRNFFETGPAFGPMPTLNLLTKETVSRKDVSLAGGIVIDESGRLIVRRTDSVVLLQDLDDIFPIDGAIEDDSLGNVIGHEIFHGIMSDLMGPDAPGGEKSQSRVGHDAHIISDYSMGFSEGWAEFFEAWTGEHNPAFDNRGGSSTVSRFLLGRQVPIRRNLYVQEDYEKFRSTKKSGRIKNGSQMMATEGLVAGIFYALATHDKIPDPLDLMMTVMYKHKPQTMPEMIVGMYDELSCPVAQRSVLLTFLHMTKFATVSGEAKSLYESYYTSRLTWLRARNDGLRGHEEERLQSAFHRARDEYRTFVRQLEARIMKGSLAIDAAVGPELWMDGRVTVGRGRLGRPRRVDFRFNLNTVTEDELVAIGVSEEGAAAFCEVRDAMGSLGEITDLRGGIPQDDYQLLSGFRVSYLKD